MEAFMLSAAASFISGVGHGAAYKVAGQLALSLEAVIAADIKHPDVLKILVELDVNASLSTIKALLEDLKRILPRCGSTMKVCFDNLRDSVASIQEQLETVETKCKTHNVSYWSYIYTYPDVTNELNRIKQLKTIMDRRIDLVTQSTTIELQIASFNKTRKIKHTQPMVRKQIQRQIQTNDTFDDENEYVFVEKAKIKS